MRVKLIIKFYAGFRNSPSKMLKTQLKTVRFQLFYDPDFMNNNVIKKKKNLIANILGFEFTTNDDCLINGIYK